MSAVGKVFLDCGGPTHEIRVSGKTYNFEMHSYLGPMMTDMKGNGLKREPVHVLEAISYWAQQGSRKDSNGRCIWEQPAEEWWVCACAKHNEKGRLLAFKTNEPSVKKCRDCGQKKPHAH